MAATKKRVRTPTVLQMEAVECGAAALAIILAYHGRWVTLEELRVCCGVTRDGSKASNILKGARSFGLEAEGFKSQLADLTNLPLPLIVFWNFNHFLVLEGISPSHYFLNDPASGPRQVTAAEFNRSFTGMALTFRPGPQFQKAGSKPSLTRALRSRLQGDRWSLAYLLLAGLALVVPGLVAPTFARIFVDDYLVKAMHGWLYPLLIGMLGTALVRAALTGLQQSVLLRLETKLAVAGSTRFFLHALQLPVQYYSQRYSGDVASRVGINDQVARLLSGQLARAFLQMLMIVFYAALMLYYSPTMTLVGLIGAGLNLAALAWVSRQRTDQNSKFQLESGKLIGVAVNGLQMIESVKSCGAESDLFGRWAGHQARSVEASQMLGVYSQVLAVIPSLISGLCTALVLGIGGMEVMAGGMTIGTLVAFQSLLDGFLRPVTSMVKLGGTLQQLEGDMNRLDDVMANPVDPETERPTLPVEGQSLSGKLELRKLTFGYNRLAEPLLQELSLTLNPGGRVALVGRSGSGRSTVARLVCGLYAPWHGEILLDGQPRSEIARQTLNNWVASVDQEVFLFEGTILENLTMWDRSIPEEKVVQAAIDACIHDAIAARPGGYRSRVEEGGSNFSGGERQRLEIARALAISPNLLIMDEATSALDPVIERQVDENLRRRGCSCLIIAHRLSTIRDCDEILVLDEGRVVARGSHQQLMEQSGIYQEMMTSGQ